MEAEDAETLERVPDPPCPQCKKAQRVRRAKFDGTAPAIGGSIVVRAVDQTAQIVMEDHHMTDLRSDVREGETMAPKLAPRLQAMADNMFARPKQRGNPAAGIFGLSPQAVMRAAVSGRFQTADTVNPVATQHRNRDRAPIHIVAGDGVGKNR
jgi:hypothetical protein